MNHLLRILTAVAVLATPSTVDGHEPVLVEEGVCEEVPFRALCMTREDAVRVASELTSALSLVNDLQAQLDRCQEVGKEPLAAALTTCRSELQACYSVRLAPPVVEEVTPWWIWVTLGGSTALSFVLGFWLAGGF